MDVIRKIPKKKWASLIGNSVHTYFFHTPEWIEILEKSFSFKNESIILKINDSELIIPMVSRKRHYFFKIYDSLPLGYGGMFCNKEISSEMPSKLLKIPNRNTLFLRISFPPLFDKKVIGYLEKFKPSVEEIKSIWNYTHILKLKRGFEEIYKKFSKNRVRAIIKAEKFGFEVTESKKKEDFKDFYELLSRVSIDRWGYGEAIHPYKLYEVMSDYGNVKLILAKKDEEIAGGLVTFNYGKTVFYWISAFSEKYKEHNPTSLLFYEAIKVACENGFEIFNFGASGDLEGVRKFKESFGAKMVKLKTLKVWNKHWLKLKPFLR
jgi:hypothetical protein